MGQASMRKWERRALASLREMRGPAARATSANLGGAPVTIPVTAWEIRQRSLGLRMVRRIFGRDDG